MRLAAGLRAPPDPLAANRGCLLLREGKGGEGKGKGREGGGGEGGREKGRGGRGGEGREGRGGEGRGRTTCTPHYF